MNKLGYYSKDQVELIIEVILRSTIDKALVKEAIAEAKEFDSGAVDKYLEEHLTSVNDTLEEADDELDKQRIRNWKKYLKIDK